MLKPLKTMTSHVGLARWLAEVSDEPVAYAPRIEMAEVPSPYRYSPIIPVYEWNGMRVVWFEVAHKRYQVFPAPEVTYATESEAETFNEFLRADKGLN